MVQTLNEYIFNKATNKRPSASPADSSSSLIEYVVNRVMKRNDSGQSFEEQLDKAFQMLGKKTSAIKKEQFKQIKIATTLLEKQEDSQKLITDILNLTQEKTILEKQFYERILENQTPPEPPSEQPPEQSVPEELPVKEESKESKEQALPETEKLASGGTTEMSPPAQKSKNLNERDKQIKFADVIQLQPKASGIVAVSILKEFLSALGPLAGFFKPYVKNIATPFAIAMGVSQSIISNLLGGPVQAGEFKLKEYQKDFGKTWSKFLNDDNFISLFIDRTVDKLTGEVIGGFVPANWKDDPEFTAELNRVAQKFNINANDLLAVMLIETAGTLNPSIRNQDGSGAVGLIQFLPITATALGTTTDNLAKMTRVQQMKYVEKYLQYWKLPQGATAGHLYTAVYLPAYINKDVLSVRGEANYEQNRGLDYNNDGKITRSDLDAHVNNAKKQYKLEKGDDIGGNKLPMMPYMLIGSKSGYDVNIQGHDVTMHGAEVVVPFGNGFQVFPVMNRRYNIIEDPVGVIDRWRQIAQGSNSKLSSFVSGGTADFWKIAALASKEDSLNPQGQADVAQALYNCAAIGSYPGGRSIGAIITAPGQFEPTFHNTESWAAICDRKSAIVAAGNAQKVDMAVRSITNSSLQKEAQKFVGGRTDFMGETQKKHMKPGDVTRGRGYNFHGWFYDAKLPKPAPVPKVVSAQTVSTVAGSSNKPKIIVNQVGGESSPSFIQQVQQTITRLIPVPVFNSQRLRTELNMKRTK
jgi:hypothetical protein